MYEVQPLVIDNGSYNLKAGFGGDDRPRAIFPAVVGRRPNKNSTMIGMGDCVPLIADQALSMRNVLDLLYPVERGIVTDWDIMEELWDYTFRRELRTDSNEHPILLTEPLLNPKLNREKMTQIMCEKFEVPEMYVTNTAVLSLLAMNRDTGIVLDSGDGVTTITPVYEGHAVQHGIVRLDLAGRDLTDYLMKLLSDRGLPFKTTTEREIVRDIKEKLCYVALDYEQEIVTATNTSDVMRQVENFQGLEPHEINSERFRCPEALFQPSLLGLETAGVHEHINNAILKCDNTLHSTLYNNVVLSGGSTMFPGMMERLQKELTVLAPGKAVKVVGSPIRHFSAWLGGSLMTSMYMRDRWITKQEYEENGAKIVHRKCIQ